MKPFSFCPSHCFLDFFLFFFFLSLLPPFAPEASRVPLSQRCQRGMCVMIQPRENLNTLMEEIKIIVTLNVSTSKVKHNQCFSLLLYPRMKQDLGWIERECTHQCFYVSLTSDYWLECVNMQRKIRINGHQMSIFASLIPQFQREYSHFTCKGKI